MRKISIVLIGIIGVTIGIQYIPKEEQKVLIEEELNNNNTSLAFYIEQEDGNYEESLSLPSTGYTLDTEKSICTNNTTPIWEGDRLYLDNLQNKGTSCYLYFKIYEPTAKDIILSHYDTVLTRSDFSTAVTDTTTGTIYKSLDSSQYDNDGEVYYFAGNPQDNWVQFGGFYWRIIRINGDGTIRIIYNGTSTATTGTSTQLSSTSAFNSSYNNNVYVGFKYTSGSVHGTGTNSTIFTALNSWYSSNLASYADDIDMNAGFCNDRYPSTSSSTSNGSGGTGTTTTYYAAYIRLNTNKAPTFSCKTSSDLFTVSGSTKGNK